MSGICSKSGVSSSSDEAYGAPMREWAGSPWPLIAFVIAAPATPAARPQARLTPTTRPIILLLRRSRTVVGAPGAPPGIGIAVRGGTGPVGAPVLI